MKQFYALGSNRPDRANPPPRRFTKGVRLPLELLFQHSPATPFFELALGLATHYDGSPGFEGALFET
jgi:hypothetical protein